MRIESMFNVQHSREFGLVVHQGHKLPLLNAHTMFTTEAATFAYSQFNHLAPGRVHALHQVFILFVWNQHQRMQVAVPGMKDVADAQLIMLADLVDFQQCLSQATAWHSNIYRIIRWRQACNRPGRALASKPDLVALLFSAGNPQAMRTLRAQNSGYFFDLPIQAGGIAIDLDNQHSLCFSRQSSMHICFYNTNN